LPWYSKSKLLLVEHVSSDEVLVNMANPSMTRGTAFFCNAPAVVPQLAAVVRFLLVRTVAVGASTYIDAAMAQGKKRHGTLTSDWVIKSCVISTLLVMSTPEREAYIHE
jgi:hypothetical protein